MTSKPLPPIADRTLAFIVESAGGNLEVNQGEVTLTIGSQTIEAANNTELLVKALELLRTL